jgi:hypothetical protein
MRRFAPTLLLALPFAVVLVAEAVVRREPRPQACAVDSGAGTSQRRSEESDSHVGHTVRRFTRPGPDGSRMVSDRLAVYATPIWVHNSVAIDVQDRGGASGNGTAVIALTVTRDGAGNITSASADFQSASPDFLPGPGSRPPISTAPQPVVTEELSSMSAVTARREVSLPIASLLGDEGSPL